MAPRKINLATASTEREAFIQFCQTCCPSNIVNISTAVRLLGAKDNTEWYRWHSEDHRWVIYETVQSNKRYDMTSGYFWLDSGW